MRRWLGVVLAVAMVVPMAGAGELAGVRMPDQVTVGGEQLTLNGMGLRKKLWVKVYVGGLYLEQCGLPAEKVATSDQTKRMVMHFLTDKATGPKVRDAWVEGFAANNPDALVAQLQPKITTFVAWFPDMKDGSKVEMDLVPGEGTTVRVDGKVVGTIAGDDFQDALVRVWVGDAPPTDDFKVGVLGG